MRSPLSRTQRAPASAPAGCATTSAAEIITCAKPASRTAASLRSSVPASDAVSMPKSAKFIFLLAGCPGSLCTSSNITLPR